MVLAFRRRDYQMISDTADRMGKDITDVIFDACRVIGRDPNFYTNPDNMGDYQDVKLIRIPLRKREFEMIIAKANFHNYSVETFVYEAVKMYQTLYWDELEIEKIHS